MGLLVFSPVFSRQLPEICGTWRGRLQEELAFHRQAQRRRLLSKSAAVAAQAVSAGRPDMGDLAIIEDTDGVVSRRNDFNLDNKTLTFTPSADKAARYRFAVSDSTTYDAAAASAGTPLAGLGDDDNRPVSLPFSFPFFGATYQQVFVNSDGNLTFGASDSDSSARSLGRLTAGPPRVAPLFRDLDPTQSRNGVYVLADSTRLVVSWVAVPEYRDAGIGSPQTFQVRLFTDGRIEFAYAGVTNDADGVVGISPGSLRGSSSVVSFVNDGGSQDYSGAIAEHFSLSNDIDFVIAAQKFYESHDDAYDYLVFFNSLGIADGPSSYASEITVRDMGSGFGDQPVDVGRTYGSAARLHARVNLGPLTQYPRDASGLINLNAGMSGRPYDTPITILAHEAGHLFLAYASVRDPVDPHALPMLGFQNAHWSFNFNSEASLAEGNRIQDKGAGVSPRFLTTAASEGYSPLDQYLMGLRPPQDVPPLHQMFFVAGSKYSNLNHPQIGISFNGERRDVGIDELIAAVGRRTPDYTVAPNRFRFGFVLIVKQGTTPVDNDLASVSAFRQAFEQYFSKATSSLASADTTLRRSLGLSLFPAAGVLQGCTMPASVNLSHPAEADLTINLSSRNGLTTVPASVVVPAGATRAAFSIAGMRAGVDEIVATPSDSTYETVVSRVQVAGSAAGLRLLLVSGDSQAATAGTPLAQPVVLQVVDINRLPYPGVKVNAVVSAGGSLASSSGLTGENGSISFQWTPGPNPQNVLSANIDGVTGDAVEVTALGRPYLETAGVVNAASYRPGIAPGSLASIFGVNFASAAADAASLPWPTMLGNIQVSLNGRALPLLAVRSGQVNFLVPPDIAPGPGALQVTTLIGTSAAVQVSIASVAPGIFFDTASNIGAVLVAGTGQKTNTRAAARGDYVEIYCTGLGSTHSGLTDVPVRVFIGGQQALDVPYNGLAPGYVGLYQVNAKVPDTVASGLQPLYLEIGGARSNAVNIQVK